MMGNEAESKPAIDSLLSWSNANTGRILLCLLSIGVSSSLIIINKDLMRVKGFHYPLSLSSLGLSFSAIVASVCGRWGFIEIREDTRKLVASNEWYRTCLPVGLAKATTLALSNTAYLYLNMGFIQMFFCFSPVVVMAVMLCFGVGVLKHGVVPSVILICCGTALTVGFDPSANVTGVALICGSTYCEATSIVLTQRLLHDRGLRVMEAQYALAPAGAAALLGWAAILEWGRIAEEGGARLVVRHPFMFLAAGTLGLCVNLVSFQVVKTLSSLSLKVLNMFRGFGIVMCGVFFYAEEVSGKELAGYAMAAAGFLSYHHFSSRPLPHPPPTPSPPLSPHLRNAARDAARGSFGSADPPVPDGPPTALEMTPQQETMYSISPEHHLATPDSGVPRTRI